MNTDKEIKEISNLLATLGEQTIRLSTDMAKMWNHYEAQQARIASLSLVLSTVLGYSENNAALLHAISTVKEKIADQWLSSSVSDMFIQTFEKDIDMLIKSLRPHQTL